MAGGTASPQRSARQPEPRKSRCQEPQPVGAPHAWHFHTDTKLGEDVWKDMVSAIDAAVTAHGRPGLDRIQVVNGLIGDVRGLLRQAAKGRLRQGALLKPISRDPLLWELRWDFKRYGRWRQYHSEPTPSPHLLVALHFHRKLEVPGDTEATRTAQNGEIEKASRRYANGAKYTGVHPSGCTGCKEP